MNSNSLKFFIKVTKTLNYKNTYRPAIASAILFRHELYSRYPCRTYSTRTDSFNFKDFTFLDGIKNKIKLQLKKQRLRASGYYLYESIADHLNYNDFVKELDMPDTFNTWFLITELHVWMLMTKLMADPEYGRYVRNILVEALWKDVSTRAKKLGPEHMSVIRSQINELSEEFQAALVNYDEGILSDDSVLAGALWRRFFSRNCTPEQLEGLIKYVRQTMFLLDKIGSEEFVLEKQIRWIQLSDVFKSLPK